MRILYLNHYAGSLRHGMAFRPYYLSKYLLKRGVEVSIVAASHSHLRSTQPNIRKHMEVEKIDGIPFFWIKTNKYSGNGIARVVNIFSFLIGLFFRARAIIRRTQPDYVIASSTYPMDIFVAKYIAILSGAKVVFELHDVWPESLIEVGGMSRWHPFVILVALSERVVYRMADLVISMLPTAADHCETLGFDRKKVVVVPNGFDLESWENDSSDLLSSDVAQYMAECRNRGDFVIGYVGAHGVPNNLETLLEAAQKLPAGFRIVLVGGGNYKKRLETLVQSSGLQNVQFFDSIPKASVPQFLKQCNAAYIGAKKSRLYRHGISPNKLMDYMMAGVPIVSAIEAGNDPVSEAGCGISVPAESPEDVVRAIHSLASLNSSERKEIGQKGISYAKKNYAYDELANKFLFALQELK